MGRRSRRIGLNLEPFLDILTCMIGVFILVNLVIGNALRLLGDPEAFHVYTLERATLFMDEAACGPGDDPALPRFGNRGKTPLFVDIWRDRLIIYPEGSVVCAVDLQRPDNRFEQLLRRMEQRRDREYLLLLVRPGSAHLFRRLRAAIRDRHLDLGTELYEEGRPVEINGVAMPMPAMPDKPADSPTAGSAPQARTRDPS